MNNLYFLPEEDDNVNGFMIQGSGVKNLPGDLQVPTLRLELEA